MWRMQAGNRTGAGIAMMLGFAVFGPVIDVFAKLSAEAIPIGQIVASRFLVQSALLVPLIAVLGLVHRPDRIELALHALRGIIVAAATLFFFGAVKVMPLADALAIFFVEPFLLVFLGAWLLDEGLGWRKVIPCVIGFAGALMVIRPRFDEFGWVAALPLGTALCFALYAILTRHMAGRGNPLTLQAYTGLAALILSLPALAAFQGTGQPCFDPVRPDARFALYLGFMGLAATIAHVFISFAFTLAPASVLAPLGYLEIVSGTALGWFVFADFPDRWTAAGIAVIVASGLFILWAERPRPDAPVLTEAP
jgi:drug/metabolite transporter (DMT)-like permease